MDDFELFEKIEAFLKGELSPEEMKNFELNIKNNSSLAEAVELHRLEWDAMEVLIENALREKMVYWNKPFTHDSPSSESQETEEKETEPLLKTAYKYHNTRLLYWKWAIAAGVALLLSASICIYYQVKTPSLEITHTTTATEPVSPADKWATPPQYTTDTNDNSALSQSKTLQESTKEVINQPKEQTSVTPNGATEVNSFRAIAEEAYEKEDIPNYEAMQATRGSSISNSILEQAGKAYDKKDFTHAITLLKNIPATDENFLALEILAHAYFQSQNYRAALPVFQNLLQLSGRKSLEKSEWYLLLCYLANYDTYQKDFNALAQKIISNKEHTYFAETTTLVERIRRK